MNADTDMPRRRDVEGDFHRIKPGTCPDCGCALFVAEEDAELIWEPGLAWDEQCSNRDCHCHTEPVIGERRA